MTHAMPSIPVAQPAMARHRLIRHPLARHRFTRHRFTLGIILLLWMGSMAGAAEPPGVWYLSAEPSGHGHDRVVALTVGGGWDVPPRQEWQVALGWQWTESRRSGSLVDEYPSLPGGQAQWDEFSQPWRAEADLLGMPSLGIGEAGVVFVLADSPAQLVEASHWADFLDLLEAAWRHAMPGLAARERQGEVVVGRLGDCPVFSTPVDGDTEGWRPLKSRRHLITGASGVHVAHGSNRREELRVGRFLRYLDSRDPKRCLGPRSTWSFLPNPWTDTGDTSQHLFQVTGVDVATPSSMDLAPKPRTAGLRVLAPIRAGDVHVNLVAWPASDQGRFDLCRAPLMAEACAIDGELRRRFATAGTVSGALTQRLRDACRWQLGGPLGSDSANHGLLCRSGEAWSQGNGVYRTEYRGPLTLLDEPHVESVVGRDGRVHWWVPRHELKRLAGDLTFPLADGTRVFVDLPGVAPPNARVASGTGVPADEVRTRMNSRPDRLGPAGTVALAAMAAVQPTAVEPTAVESMVDRTPAQTVTADRLSTVPRQPAPTPGIDPSQVQSSTQTHSARPTSRTAASQTAASQTAASQTATAASPEGAVVLAANSPTDSAMDDDPPMARIPTDGATVAGTVSAGSTVPEGSTSPKDSTVPEGFTGSATSSPLAAPPWSNPPGGSTLAGIAAALVGVFASLFFLGQRRPGQGRGAREPGRVFSRDDESESVFLMDLPGPAAAEESSADDLLLDTARPSAPEAQAAPNAETMMEGSAMEGSAALAALLDEAETGELPTVHPTAPPPVMPVVPPNVDAMEAAVEGTVASETTEATGDVVADAAGATVLAFTPRADRGVEPTAPESTTAESTTAEPTTAEPTVPDTTVPEATVPDTTVSEPTVPDATVPAVTVPAVTASEPVGSVEATSTQAPQGTGVASQLLQELAVLPPSERDGLGQTLVAAQRLGDWVSALLPVFQRVDQGLEPAVDLGALPEPAQGEWRASLATVRDYAHRGAELFRHLQKALDDPSCAVPEGVDTGDLLDPAVPLRERLRRHLVAPDRHGHVADVVRALQYLLEAFPLEQLRPDGAQAYRQALREALGEHGQRVSFHQLFAELAAGLGLRYETVRLYKTALEHHDFLRPAHGRVALAEKLGYPAETDPGIVVRLAELFLFEPNSVRYSGRALVGVSW